MGSNDLEWARKHLKAAKHPKYYTPEPPKDGMIKKIAYKIKEFLDPRNPF